MGPNCGPVLALVGLYRSLDPIKAQGLRAHSRVPRPLKGSRNEYRSQKSTIISVDFHLRYSIPVLDKESRTMISASISLSRLPQ